MKGKLRLLQEEFNYKMSLLVVWAHENGIPTTRGDAHRDERVHGKWGVKMGYGAAKSVHKVKLAQDLNAENDADHIRLHDKWDELGGAPRIINDMNHYSMKWEGHW